jgi:hypothetical protein
LGGLGAELGDLPEAGETTREQDVAVVMIVFPVTNIPLATIRRRS